MKTEKREKAVPKCLRSLDTSGRDNKVKPNASNTDETELMCHDQEDGYRTVTGVSVTTATSIIICCLMKCLI